MKKNIKKIRNGLVIAGFLIIPMALMTWSVMKEAKVSCQVCMSHNGHDNCAKAEGNTKEACVSTARDNACAIIASGMTASIQCSQSTPISVEVK